MKRLASILSLFLLASPKLYGARSVFTTAPSAQFVSITISNPSSVAQHVGVRFTSGGKPALATCPGCQWGNGISCPSIMNCTNTIPTALASSWDASNTIAPSKSLTFAIQAPLPSSGLQGSDSGMFITLSVVEANGYLIAGGNTGYGAGPMHSPLVFAGGKPF